MELEVVGFEAMANPGPDTLLLTDDPESRELKYKLTLRRQSILKNM